MKVLIVDDDADIRRALIDVLSLEGHRSVAVADGSEALAYLAKDEAVCVILLDLMMPRMNGWEFREKQQADPAISSIPIVVITADGNVSAKARQLGAAAFLKKPMDVDDLVDTVNKFCPLAS